MIFSSSGYSMLMSKMTQASAITTAKRTNKITKRSVGLRQRIKGGKLFDGFRGHLS